MGGVTLRERTPLPSPTRRRYLEVVPPTPVRFLGVRVRHHDHICAIFKALDVASFKYRAR